MVPLNLFSTYLFNVNCALSDFFFLADKQAPTIVYCPESIYQAISGSGATVTWSEPQFTDNVKVERVTSTKKSGDYFQLGSTLVKYDAFDQSGRFVSCTFTVKLTGKFVYSTVSRDKAQRAP